MRMPDQSSKHGARTLRARLSGLVTVALAVLLIEPQVCLAKPRETLDPSFGNNGRVLMRFPGKRGMVWALALGQDGSVFAVGTAGNEYESQGVIAKYGSDGRPDSSFGAQGKVLDDDLDVAQAVCVQPDRKVLAVGSYQDSGYPGEPAFALERYNPDGSLDTTFGTGGKVFDSFVGTNGFVTSIGLQPDGKILVGGSYTFQVQVGSSLVTNGDFALSRYNPDGTLDTAFGNSGKVITDFKGQYDLLESFLVQPDGKIVAGGSVNVSGNPWDGVFGFARYNADGSLDSTFGNGGLATVSLAAGYTGKLGLALAANGKIVAGGSSNVGPALVRLNPDGTPDNSFGQGGQIAPFQAVPAGILAISLQPDGRILASGWDVAGPASLFVARCNEDGTVDSSIGETGLLSGEFFGEPGSILSAIFQPDGKVLAGGFAGRRLALARYKVALN